MKRRIASLLHYRPGKLALNTIAGTIWQGIRVALQAFWILVIARLLAPEGYGDFAGLAGLATTLGGLCGLGLGLVMYQKVARDPSSFGAYWHIAARLTLASGVLFTVGFVPVAGYLGYRHLGLLTITAISAAELIFFPVVTLCAFAFAAHERSGYAAGIPALMSAARLFAALGFWIMPIQHDLAAYALFHLGASIIGSVAALALTIRCLRPTSCHAHVTAHDLREGIGFSALWSSGLALTSADKFLVLHFSGSSTAGLYAAAYRFASLLVQPMDALTSAAAPRLFRRTATGKTQYQRLLCLLALAIAGYAIFAGIFLAASAGLLPLLLGTAFAPAVPETRWMALMLPFFGLRLLGTNVLMTSGRKSTRLAIEIGGLVIMFSLCSWWAPKFGLRGAVMMIIVTEAILAILVWLSICFDKKHDFRIDTAHC